MDSDIHFLDADKFIPVEIADKIKIIVLNYKADKSSVKNVINKIPKNDVYNNCIAINGENIKSLVVNSGNIGGDIYVKD